MAATVLPLLSAEDVRLGPDPTASLLNAADILAVLLLGTLLFVYGTLAGFGFVLWCRSRVPQKPHEELIALLQKEGERDGGG